MAADGKAMDALSQALKLEQDGYAFYHRALERVQDATCREMLISLADDEKVHEAMIARQMQALREEGGFVVVPGAVPGDADLSARLFPPDPARASKKVGSLSTELEVIQMALEIEVDSYDYYRQASEASDDPEGRLVFRWLAEAEQTHFNLLMSNYEAINQRATWA